MQSPINYHILASSMVLNFDGQTHTISKGDARYATITQAIRENRLNDVRDLVNIEKSYSHSGLVLKDNLLWLDGEALPDTLSDRVLAFQQEQLPFEHLIKFARKLRKNPSYNSRVQLFKFLEHNGHPITTEGNFIAYRGIREDFKDMHTGKFDNRPGQVCEMKREDVDDNPNNTCSRGLHVACYEYAKGFGQKLVEVEVDPQDVVCVPVDYNGTKMRTCKFKVVSEAERMNEKQLVNSSYDVSPPDMDDSFAKDDLDWENDYDSDGTDDSDLDTVYVVELKPSKFIVQAKYDSGDELLEVELVNGDTYEYFNVPYGIVSDWERASSVGSFYSRNIANVYSFNKL